MAGDSVPALLPQAIGLKGLPSLTGLGFIIYAYPALKCWAKLCRLATRDWIPAGSINSSNATEQQILRLRVRPIRKRADRKNFADAPLRMTR